MWYPAEIVLKSYLPLELEEGMLFVNRISVGIIESYVELWELDNDIPDDIHAFMATNGAPIELFIIDDNENILANEEELGWWDEGEHVEDLRELTLDDINLILREYNGDIEIEMEIDDNDVLTPVYYDEEVALRLPQQENEWDVILNDGLENE